MPPLPEHYICMNLGAPHRLRFECDGRSHAGIRGNGDIVVMPAAKASYWHRDAAGDGLHLFVQPSFLASVAAGTGLAYGEPDLAAAFCVRDPQIEHIGIALQAEADQGCPNGSLYGESLATALAVHMLRRYSITPRATSEPAGGLTPARLRRAVDFIQSYLGQDISIAQVADAAGISPFHFARQFRRSTGLSPHQYLTERRVERAREMLLNGAGTIGEVASAVGFADQSHLSRHFKRLVGTTPGHFAKR